MNQYVKSDLFRYYGKSDWLTFVKAILRNDAFRFQYAFRMCKCRGVLKYWGGYCGFLIEPEKESACQDRRRLDMDYTLDMEGLLLLIQQL